MFLTLRKKKKKKKNYLFLIGQLPSLFRILLTSKAKLPAQRREAEAGREAKELMRVVVGPIATCRKSEDFVPDKMRLKKKNPKIFQQKTGFWGKAKDPKSP